MSTQKIPDGYMKNEQGLLQHVSLVSAIDLERDELVKNIVEKARALQIAMKEFKDVCMDEVQAFVDLSAQEYDKGLGGIKGNVQLLTYDGSLKVQRAISESVGFDERIQVAKELVNNCINRWSEGSRVEIKALVQSAFQTDNTGKLNKNNILGLLKLDIDDDEWKKAMQAISDSMYVTGSKRYLRIYERVGASDQWQPIALDIAAL